MASFAELADQLHIWAYVKVAYLFFILLYIIFAIIVVRQVSLMIKTLDGSLNLPLKTISYIHLVVAVLVFFLALFVL